MMIYKKLSIAILIVSAAASAAANGVVDCTPGNQDSTCITAAPPLPPSFCPNVNGWWFKDADEAMLSGYVYRSPTGSCYKADSPVAIAALGGGGGGGGSANKGPNNSWSAPGMTGGYSEGFNASGQTSPGNPGSAGPGTSTTGGDGGGTGGTGGGGGGD